MLERQKSNKEINIVLFLIFMYMEYLWLDWEVFWSEKANQKQVEEAYNRKLQKTPKYFSSIGKWGGQLKTTKPEIRDFMI